MSEVTIPTIMQEGRFCLRIGAHERQGGKELPQGLEAPTGILSFFQRTWIQPLKEDKICGNAAPLHKYWELQKGES